MQITIARIAKLPARSLRHIADSKRCEKKIAQIANSRRAHCAIHESVSRNSQYLNAAAGMIRSNSDGSFYTRLRRYISEFCDFVGERSHLRSRMTKLLQFCKDGCSFVHPRIAENTCPHVVRKTSEHYQNTSTSDPHQGLIKTTNS